MEVQMSVQEMVNQMRADSAKKGPLCGAGIAYKKLGKDEQQAMSEAMKDESIMIVAICRWLSEKGHQVRPHTMSRHRRNECGCAK
jgi:hypothetical protein